MIITVQCPSCETSFPVDPRKVPEGGVKVRCSSCSGIFFVDKPDIPSVADLAPSAPHAEPAQPTEASQPTEPTEPAEAPQPTEPVAEAADPTEPVAEDSQPTEPAAEASPAAEPVAEALEEAVGDTEQWDAADFDDPSHGVHHDHGSPDPWSGGMDLPDSDADTGAEPAVESQPTWDAPEPAAESEATWEAPEAAAESEATWEAPEAAAESEATWEPPEPATETEATWEAPEPALESEATWEAPEPASEAPEPASEAPEPAVERLETVEDLTRAAAAEFPRDEPFDDPDDAWGDPTPAAEAPVDSFDDHDSAVEPEAPLDSFGDHDSGDAPDAPSRAASAGEMSDSGHGSDPEGETGGNVEVAAPPVAAPAPSKFQFGRRDPDDKARRLARVLVSDIITYNPERHQRALEQDTLHADFEDEIRKSWAEYVEQVGRERAESTPYWFDALNEILARGRKVF